MNPDLVRRRCSVLSAALLIGALCSNQGLAQGTYQGKTLTVVVGTDAGGGTTSMAALWHGTSASICLGIPPSLCKTCRVRAA